MIPATRVIAVALLAALSLSVSLLLLRLPPLAWDGAPPCQQVQMSADGCAR